MSGAGLQHAQDVPLAPVRAGLPAVRHLGGRHQDRGAGQARQRLLRLQVQSEEIRECFTCYCGPLRVALLKVKREVLSTDCCLCTSRRKLNGGELGVFEQVAVTD